MWASFVAIGLMVAASLLITFARQKTKGAIRLVLSLVAFVLLLGGLLYMIPSLL